MTSFFKNLNDNLMGLIMQNYNEQIHDHIRTFMNNDKFTIIINNLDKPNLVNYNIDKIDNSKNINLSNPGKSYISGDLQKIRKIISVINKNFYEIQKICTSLSHEVSSDEDETIMFQLIENDLISIKNKFEDVKNNCKMYIPIFKLIESKLVELQNKIIDDYQIIDKNLYLLRINKLIGIVNNDLLRSRKLIENEVKLRDSSMEDIESIKRIITILNANFIKLNNNFTTINTNFCRLKCDSKKKFDYLLNQIIKIEKTLLSLGAIFRLIEDNFNKLKGKTKELDSKVNDFGKTIATTQKDINLLQSRFSAILNKYNSLNQRLTVVEEIVKENGNIVNQEINTTILNSTNINVIENITAAGVIANKVQTEEFLLLSDSRLKKDIKNIDNPDKKKLFQLKGKKYKFKDNKIEDYGFIAQEVEELFPNLVSTNEDGIKSVKYTQFIPIIIENMKKQNQEIFILKILIIIIVVIFIIFLCFRKCI